MTAVMSPEQQGEHHYPGPGDTAVLVFLRSYRHTVAYLCFVVTVVVVLFVLSAFGVCPDIDNAAPAWVGTTTTQGSIT